MLRFINKEDFQSSRSAYNTKKHGGFEMKIDGNAIYPLYLQHIPQAKSDAQRSLTSPLPSGHADSTLDCADPVYWIDSVDALGQPCQIGVTREDILNQYEEWKAKQPPLEIPNKNGWSSANMKFLEDRYGDCKELPVFRRFELLDVLQEMNILDGQGLQEKIFPAKMVSTDPSSSRCTGYELQDGSWLVLGEDGTRSVYSSLDACQRAEFDAQFWGDSPIKSFATLDDVLKWVEDNKQ